ncbi:MAG: SPOR domain-containing protein, partial [Leptospiraceae bacterium]|nr:SPOR domain-containing protein [Leptospiraceae bacterium]
RPIPIEYLVSDKAMKLTIEEMNENREAGEETTQDSIVEKEPEPDLPEVEEPTTPKKEEPKIVSKPKKKKTTPKWKNKKTNTKEIKKVFVKEESFPKPKYYTVQLGAFSDKNRAISLKSLESKFGAKVFVFPIGNMWKVQVGDSKNKNDAIEIQKKVISSGFPKAFVTPKD